MAINWQNLPSTTTPVNATNLNATQADIDSRAKIVYSALQIAADGTKTYTFPNVDAIYLIMIHANGDNVLRFDVVMIQNGALYTTSLHTSNYATLTYSGLTASITVQYTNLVRIVKL